jgi:hypothetical protein
MDEARKSWTTDAENGIRGLPDVEDVRIFVEDGIVREVHVISSSRKPAKLIVKDVVGLMWTRFNQRIDHRVVGVVRMRAKVNGSSNGGGNGTPRIGSPMVERVHEEPQPAHEASMSAALDQGRIRFGSVNLYMDGARAQAQVELRWKGVLRMGSASGWCSREGASRLVAAATLAALQEFLDDDMALGVEGVDVVRVSGHEVAVVGLALITHRQEKILTGCCTVGRDLPQAVVLATLSALNRVVGGLKAREPIEYVLRPALT